MISCPPGGARKFIKLMYCLKQYIDSEKRLRENCSASIPAGRQLSFCSTYGITDYQQIGDQPVESLEHSAPSCRPGALDIFICNNFPFLVARLVSLCLYQQRRCWLRIYRALQWQRRFSHSDRDEQNWLVNTRFLRLHTANFKTRLNEN